jgi:uncharacterized membrane protein YdjX (TVP38/TMEM64 family)
MPPQPKTKRHLVIHIVLFAAFLGAIAFVSIQFGPSIVRLLRNPGKFQEFIKSYGPLSALVYILIQAAQIVIAFIPGEIVQIAGGYSFGTFAGTVYSFLGTLLGTVIVFFTTRLFGYSLVKAVVPAGKLERFGRLKEQNCLPVWIVSGIALVLFVLGVLFKDRIIGLIAKLRRYRSD